MRRSSLLAVVIVLAAAAAGCPTRTKTDPTIPTPPPGTTWPVIRNDSGELSTSAGVTTYLDRTSAFTLTLPEGFTGKLSFTADPTGPPVRGAVKLRATDAGAPACVIDVAVEPSRLPDTLPQTIPFGRETFFLAETGEPRPELAVSEIWTATHVIPDSTRIDLGYWLFAATYVLRVEGRFPVGRLSTCKVALDEMVRSADSSLRPEAGADARSPG